VEALPAEGAEELYTEDMYNIISNLFLKTAGESKRVKEEPDLPAVLKMARPMPPRCDRRGTVPGND